MNLKEMNDEELICSVKIRLSDWEVTGQYVIEIIDRYASLRKKTEVKPSKWEKMNAEFDAALEKEFGGHGKEIDPDCWSMLLCGTSTLEEWFQIERYIIKRTKESRGIAPYKHGYYGFYDGNFYFSETGPFAPVIDYNQFTTIKNK